jgi:hypothetical protein
LKLSELESMADALDLIIVTFLVGPGMNASPVNQDLGAFQRLVTETLKTVGDEGIGLNLILDQDVGSAAPGFSGAKVVRFDKRRQRLTIAVAIPRDLTARKSTEFLREQAGEVLRLADDYIVRKQLPGELTNVRDALERACDGLPDVPLSEIDRYREVVHAQTSADEPIRTFAELDASGRELRKVEIYADGAMDYAVRSVQTGTTQLNNGPPKSTEVIRLISSDAFASMWQAAIAPDRPRGPITVRQTV